jgi:hypothetical protein
VEAHPATGGTRVEAGAAAEKTGMDTGSEAGREKKVEDIDFRGIGRPADKREPHPLPPDHLAAAWRRRRPGATSREGINRGADAPGGTISESLQEHRHVPQAYTSVSI